MIYKHEITPFNEFWLDCDTQIMYSILISIDEGYNVLCYCNDYIYDLRMANTLNRLTFNEIRLNQDVFALRDKIVNQVARYNFQDINEGIETIIQHIKKGCLVMIGVDLYYWVELNMCYQTHHVEHYSLVNGYDEERNIFYVMETDNERYREFEVCYEQMVQAMSHAELNYNAVVLEINSSDKTKRLYTLNELRKNARKIIKSIRQFRGREFWLYTEQDYKDGFYRDMTVMYLMQINCRMCANHLLFKYIIKYNNSTELQGISEMAYNIELGWVKVREAVSKLYFKENPVELMLEQNKNIRILLEQEIQMWRKFIKLSKFLELPEEILL